MLKNIIVLLIGILSFSPISLTAKRQMDPVAICKPITLGASGNLCRVRPVPSAFNNGSTGDELRFSISPNISFTLGEHEVTFTVTDINGLTSSCITTLTVVDPPAFNTLEQTIYLDSAGIATLDDPLSLINFSNPGRTACGGVIVIDTDDLLLSKDTFDCSDVGVNKSLLFDGNDIYGSTSHSIDPAGEALALTDFEMSFLINTRQLDRGYLFSRMSLPTPASMGAELYNYVIYVDNGRIGFLANSVNTQNMSRGLISETSPAFISDGIWYEVYINVSQSTGFTHLSIFINEFSNRDFADEDKITRFDRFFINTQLYIEPVSAEPNYRFYMGGINESNSQRFEGQIDDLRISADAEYDTLLFHDFNGDGTPFSELKDHSITDLAYSSTPAGLSSGLGLYTIDLITLGRNDSEARAPTVVNVLDTITVTLSETEKAITLNDNGDLTLSFTDLFTERTDCRITDYTLANETGSLAIDNTTDQVTISCDNLGDHLLRLTGDYYQGGQVSATFNVRVSSTLTIESRDVISRVLDATGNASITSADLDLNSGSSCSTEALQLSVESGLLDCTSLNNLGGSLFFDEPTDAVTVPENNALDLQVDFTIAAWVKTRVGTGIQRLVRKASGGGQNYSLFLQNGIPTIYYDRQPSGVVRTNGVEAINDGLWHHLAGVRNGIEDSLKLYVDGVKVSAISVAGLIPRLGDNGLSIGNSAPGDAQQLNGALDDLQIWNRPLSRDEIRAVYIDGLPENVTGLIAQYNFEEAFSQTDPFNFDTLAFIADASGINNGQFTNPDFISWSSYRNMGVQEVVLQGITDSGSQSADTTIVILQDTVTNASVMIPASLLLYLDETGNVQLTIQDLSIPSSGCFAPVSVISQTDFNCGDLSTSNMISVSLFDEAGNESMSSVAVNLLDTIRPVITPRNIILQVSDGETITILASDVVERVEKSCGIGDTILSRTTFSIADLGENLITIEAENPNAGTEFNGFATAVVTITENPLPVELVFFNSRIIEEEVILSWRTASEIDNDFFEVQRSADGKNFEMIGSVKGNGTTNEPIDYNFVDATPIRGLNYYRLKQVDFDGEFEYSRIIVESIDFHEFTLEVFPNPVSDYLNIGIGEVPANINISLVNLSGINVPIHQGIIEKETFKFDLSDIPDGIYVLALTIGEKIHRQKLLVRH